MTHWTAPATRRSREAPATPATLVDQSGNSSYAVIKMQLAGSLPPPGSPLVAPYQVTRESSARGRGRGPRPPPRACGHPARMRRALLPVEHHRASPWPPALRLPLADDVVAGNMWIESKEIVGGRDQCGRGPDHRSYCSTRTCRRPKNSCRRRTWLVYRPRSNRIASFVLSSSERASAPCARTDR